MGSALQPPSPGSQYILFCHFITPFLCLSFSPDVLDNETCTFHILCFSALPGSGHRVHFSEQEFTEYSNCNQHFLSHLQKENSPSDWGNCFLYVIRGFPLPQKILHWIWDWTKPNSKISKILGSDYNLFEVAMLYHFLICIYLYLTISPLAEVFFLN